MSTTTSMWLGILFVVLAVAAVVLQAWLWNPKYWDPIAKKTRAPKGGLLVHRWVGIAFTVIYVVMMWKMVPRLWEYQVELPARTVIHALAAIMLGVLLFTKLAILRWFRHFEEAMPQLGFGILACTLTLGTLSIPYAARAQGLGVDVMKPENIERVRTALGSVDLGDDVVIDDLVARSGLDRGRKVLVEQCTGCHDMRTILAKPRTAAGWLDVSERMIEKPSVFGAPIDADDLPYVTAYLVAITPEIQQSRQRAMADERAQAERMAAAAMPMPMPMATPMPGAPAAPAAEMPSDPFTVAPSAAVDPAQAKAKVGDVCSQCHELDEIEKHGGDSALGWAKVVRAMIAEGAEIGVDDGRVIVQWLAQTHPATAAK